MWMSPVFIFQNFVQGCRWWCMTNGLMDTHEIQIQLSFSFFIKNKKIWLCHILTLTLYKYRSWSMPQVRGVNFLTSHCNKLDLYACLLICVYVRRNSFLWMKILISGLISHLEKIWYSWMCTTGMLNSIIPTQSNVSIMWMHTVKFSFVSQHPDLNMEQHACNIIRTDLNSKYPELDDTFIVFFFTSLCW